MNPEPLFDLGRQVHRVRGQGFKIQLSVAERVRVARGFAQAVVKVVSYAKGLKRVRQLVDYISRKGALELETESGDKVIGREEGQQLAENWSGDFGNRKNGRDAVHLVFSMPKGSNPEALKRSVRSVLGKQFPAHEAVFGIHQDKDHPHAHVVLKMRGRNSEKKLSLNKPELYQLREVFAEAAREQGVQLAASPRAARGIGSKGERQAVHQMRRRGLIPNVDREAAKEALLESRTGRAGIKPWEAAMDRRHQMEKAVYASYAERLRASASQKEGVERQKLLQIAQRLERYAEQMPEPKTRRQKWIERERQKTQSQQKEKAKSQDRGMELEL